MEISFIYPEMDTDTFLETIDSFNRDISKDNLISFIPRLFVSLLLNILPYVLWLYMVRILFIRVTMFVTAQRVEIIITFLIGLVLSMLIILIGISILRKKLRPILLKALKSEEIKESFSISAYVERKDGSKLVRDEVGFYKMCDTLKKSTIIDADAICDGSVCKVEIRYVHSGNDSIFTFHFPYHDSDIDHVVVDFNRKCVIFPRRI